MLQCTRDGVERVHLCMCILYVGNGNRLDRFAVEVCDGMQGMVPDAGRRARCEPWPVSCAGTRLKVVTPCAAAPARLSDADTRQSQRNMGIFTHTLDVCSRLSTCVQNP